MAAALLVNALVLDHLTPPPPTPTPPAPELWAPRSLQKPLSLGLDDR